MAILVLAAAHFVLNHMLLGRLLYLLGSNPRAAHVAGLPEPPGAPGAPRSRLYLALSL